MEKMNSSMKRLEKDKNTLAKKNQDSQLTIIQMFEQRTADKNTIDKMKRQNDKLKQLCNTLQAQIKAKDANAVNANAVNTVNATTDVDADADSIDDNSTDSTISTVDNSLSTEKTTGAEEETKSMTGQQGSNKNAILGKS